MKGEVGFHGAYPHIIGIKAWDVQFLDAKNIQMEKLYTLVIVK